MNDLKWVEDVCVKFVDLYVVEMEVVVVVQVCYQFKMFFVVIRVLFDIVGKEFDVLFDKFLEQAVVYLIEFVLNVIK